MTEGTPAHVSRRSFIKGVIAAGAVASSSALSVPLDDAARPAVRRRQRRAPDHAQRQRPGSPRRRDAAGNARDDAPLQAGAHRHQARLRSRRVRRLHRAHRRCAALLVLGADAPRARQEGRHHRRARRSGDRQAAAPCSRASSTSRASSARSACPASSWPRPAISRPTRIRRARSSRTACPAICAAARTTTRFSRR